MTRSMDISLFVSTGIHALVAAIFLFITFSHHILLPKIIEVSLIELPQKEEKIEIEKEVKKRRVYFKRSRIGVAKPRPEFEMAREKVPQPKTRPGVVSNEQVVVPQKIVSPPQLPAPGGIKHENTSGEIPAVISTPAQGIIKEEGGEAQKTQAIAPQPQKDEGSGQAEVVVGPEPYITGPASSRKPRHRPTFSIPAWLEKKGQSLSGRFKFWVEPDGSVDRVMVEQTFGYAEIDNLAVSSVYRWRFEKLPLHETKFDWGIVTFRIRLE